MINEVGKIIIAMFLANVIAQSTKVLISKIKYKEVFDWRDFFLTGGMPSSHSAIVAALCLAVYLIEGFTVMFAVSLTLTIIVIRDALGVRRSVGVEGKAINDIIKEINKLMTAKKLDHVHYSLGHTPADVSVGIILGLVCAWVIFLI